MKKIFLLLLFANVVLGLSCCYNPKGTCNHPVRFSPNKLNFNANGGNGVITSNDDYWDMSDIYIDSTCSYHIYECLIYHSNDCPTLLVHCDSIREPDYYTDLGYRIITRISKIEGEWFSITVTKKGKYNYPQELTFEVKPNNTGRSRKVQVGIFNFNCFPPDLVITQTAE